MIQTSQLNQWAIPTAHPSVSRGVFAASTTCGPETPQTWWAALAGGKDRIKNNSSITKNNNNNGVSQMRWETCLLARSIITVVISIPADTLVQGWERNTDFVNVTHDYFGVIVIGWQDEVLQSCKSMLLNVSAKISRRTKANFLIKRKYSSSKILYSKHRDQAAREEVKN